MKDLKFRGRPPILIAQSVKDVVSLQNTYAQAIFDRTIPITPDFVQAVIDQSVFSWEGRSPTPALDEHGRFQGTDLDLLSFLAPIAERGAIIEIPHYRSRRVNQVRKDERHVGRGNRFGKVIGLISNKDVFSFSIRIIDNTIVKRDQRTEEESSGAFRNFMLVDITGKWHDGWDKIVWDPTAAENAFLNENELWTGNTVFFKNAVHPNRWQSVFGAPYFLLKMLIERLTEEGKFYKQEVGRLMKLGLRIPGTGVKMPTEPVEYTSEGQSVQVDTLEAILDIPSFHGTYLPAPNTVEGLIAADKRQRLLTWTLRPKAQFIVRADELAYFKYGNERIATWMTGREWRPFTPPRGRILWNQMVLSSDVAYRYRTKTVTERVASQE